MRRYWISDANFSGKHIQIQGDEFHHICDVCRQGVGDRFEVLKGDGLAYLVELKSKSKKNATAEIISERQVPEIKKPYIHLCVSIPKFPTLETILEKSVELGVKEVTPFVSSYSFVREINSEKLINKSERWQKIIKGATQQSGRSELMKINPVTSLKALLGQFNQSAAVAGLFPYEGDSKYVMKQAVQDCLKIKPETIWVFIGSEGGFSQEEVKLFQGVRLNPATLGDQVLRVETACLSIIGILRYEIEAL